MAQEEMLTGKKIAEKLGISPSKVTKYLKEHNVEPDQKRGACKYYGNKTIKQIEKALKNTYEAGIGNKGNLIFGDKAETMDTVNASLNWWNEHIQYQLQPSRLSAYPGTPLYHHAVKEGIIKDKAEYLRRGEWINVSTMDDEEWEKMRRLVSYARMYLCRIHAPVLSCKKVDWSEIKGHVRRNLNIFKPGGGYVFNNVHNIQAGVPPENIVALYDAAYRFGFTS